MANYRKIGSDFSEGLRVPHYTNGRLLTAEDLQQGQQTQLARQAQLGQAAGYGIVEGFRVTAVANNSALSITAGLGLNRQGNVIELTAEKVSLPIQPVNDESTPLRRAARFAACNDDDPDQPTAVTSGAYLLTVSPLAQLQGAVPRQDCNGNSTSTCANQWEVEGVEFKIVRLTNYSAPTGNRANRNRNLLAHWFYGSEKINVLMRDPLKFPANYTGFSQIDAQDFSECDLPLAVFYWSNSSIAFVDEWAVRRRLVHPFPADKWTANISDQRQAEGHARFLQFQEHIADLQTQSGNQTDNLRAVDRFAYLPPVGILPVNPFELIVADVFDQAILQRQQAEIKERGLTTAEVLDHVRVAVLSALGSANAYNLDRFFGNLLSSHYQIVHEDFIHNRLHQSWVQPPILLPPPPSIVNFFQFKMADGTLLAVDNGNFNAALLNINSNFSGSVYNVTTPETAVATADLATDTIATINAAPINISSAAGLALLNQNFTLRPPLEIFNPPRNDDDDVEPLVDILVMDELLDPYRSQLSQEMVGRIDASITALAGNGGVFIGNNRFTAFNNSIANAFALNNFLWQGANYGFIDISNLLQLVKSISAPIFYVVFVRHRPQTVQRPLRL